MWKPPWESLVKWSEIAGKSWCGSTDCIRATTGSKNSSHVHSLHGLADASFTPPSGLAIPIIPSGSMWCFTTIGFVYGELSKPSGPLPLVTPPRQCPQMFVQMFVARWNRNCRHHERELRYVIVSDVNHRCSLKDRFRRALMKNISGFPQFRLTRLPWILLRGLCWLLVTVAVFPLSAGAEDRVPGGNRGSVEDQGPKTSWQVGGSAFYTTGKYGTDVRTDTLYVPTRLRRVFDNGDL